MVFGGKGLLTPKRNTSPQPQPQYPIETDWVSNAFRVAELASAAGSLLPFPYLKGAADLVKILLKTIQQVQQNQDGYKELTITIVTILKILHEETKKNSETASSLNYFEKDCEKFHQYLQNISEDLKSCNKSNKPKLLRGFFRANREKDVLMRYQNQIKRFRSNLMFRGIIRLRISSNTDEMDSHFEQIRLGDLHVLEKTSYGQVEHWKVRWKQEAQTRMVRVYKGRDAISKFKAEKDWYTRYRHPNLIQLFGIITSKENPGLIFYNPWCIPIVQFVSRFGDALGYIDTYRAALSSAEGLQYVAENMSQHAFLAWRGLRFSRAFVAFKNREDGYLASCHVDVIDRRGFVVFEWLPNILQGIPAYHYRRVSIRNISQEESANVMERVDMLQSSQKSYVPLDPSFLWDLYDSMYLTTWEDISAPAYPVYTGYILLADKHNNALDASNAAILGFIPCEGPSSSDWLIRNKLLHTKLTIEDYGEHFRIRLPVDTPGISATGADDLQAVVVECDVLCLNNNAWERLARAYVSQIGCLRSRTNGVHDLSTVCVVTGFSWHLQIPSKLRCSAETFEYKELYFFISKPAVHNETPTTYWSLDPSGIEKIDSSEMNTLGFDSTSLGVRVRRTLRVFIVPHEQFEFIQRALAMMNIDPESDEGARILGLPLIRLIQPESGDVVPDDSDLDSASPESYHTAEYEAGGGSVSRGVYSHWSHIRRD